MYDHDCGRWRAYPAGSDLVDHEQFGMTVINQAEMAVGAGRSQEQPAGITDINMP